MKDAQHVRQRIVRDVHDMAASGSVETRADARRPLRRGRHAQPRMLPLVIVIVVPTIGLMNPVRRGGGIIDAAAADGLPDDLIQFQIRRESGALKFMRSDAAAPGAFQSFFSSIDFRSAGACTAQRLAWS